MGTRRILAWSFGLWHNSASISFGFGTCKHWPASDKPHRAIALCVRSDTRRAGTGWERLRIMEKTSTGKEHVYKTMETGRDRMRRCYAQSGTTATQERSKSEWSSQYPSSSHCRIARDSSVLPLAAITLDISEKPPWSAFARIAMRRCGKFCGRVLAYFHSSRFIGRRLYFLARK